MAMVYCDMGDNLTGACRTKEFEIPTNHQEESVNKPEHDGASRQMPID